MGSYGKVRQCARGQTAKNRRFPNVQTAKGVKLLKTADSNVQTAKNRS